MVITTPNSSVIRISPTLRNCHMLMLLPFTTTEIDADGRLIRQPIDFTMYLGAAGFLAVKHFNERNLQFVSDVPINLDQCDIQMSIELRDTRFNSADAVRQLQEVYARFPEKSIERPLPFALVGAARSAVSLALAVLGGVYKLPQISATSTSVALDNKGRAPFFTRTIPSDAGSAVGLATYLYEAGLQYIGVLYVRDSYGIAYHEDLLKELLKRGLTIVSAPHNDGDDGSIVEAVERLQRANVKYVVGIFNPQTWKLVVRAANKHGIIGRPGYTWFLTDSSIFMTDPDFRLDRENDAEVAHALHGTAMFLADIPSDPIFESYLEKFQTNTTLQQAFTGAQAESAVFEGFRWNFSGGSFFHYLNYDAVMALGIAACAANNDMFTGDELLTSILQTEFHGVSGYVRFNENTGTRKADDLKYRIENIILSDEASSESYFGFESSVSIVIDLRNEDPIKAIKPFIYFDNSTTPHTDLPPVSVEMNLVATELLALGWSLCGLCLLCTVFWLCWTLQHRNIDVVRVSQPIFLGTVCMGAFIMALSIIPMGFQEPFSQAVLDASCMLTPWLFTIGFVTAFSALFSKTWRLNRLFKQGSNFRRMELRAQDVLYPFIVLATLNMSLMAAWTAFSPLRWERRDRVNLDEFGRNIESYGTCALGDPKQKWVQNLVITALVAVNLAALVFANYQCYLARKLPTNFNESFHVAMTNAALLEAVIVGGPILFVVHDNPSAVFVVRSILVTIVVLTIVLPIFIPKSLQRNISLRKRKAGFGNRGFNISQRVEWGSSSTPTVLDSFKAGMSSIKRNEDYYFQMPPAKSPDTHQSSGTPLRPQKLDATKSTLE